MGMRLATSLPELLTLIKGIFNAARAVGVVLLFMILLTYVFAIIFTSQIGDPDAPEHTVPPYWEEDITPLQEGPTAVSLFGTMGDSMMSLFTRGVLGDNLAETLQAIHYQNGDWTCEDDCDDEGECSQVCERPSCNVKVYLWDDSPEHPCGGSLLLMWIFIAFCIISAFCLLNMLVGVLCEVITTTESEETETKYIIELHRNITKSFQDIDTSGDDLITKSEWHQMTQDERLCESFKNIGVPDNFMDVSLKRIEDHLFGRIPHNQIPGDGDWFPVLGATQETGAHEDRKKKGIAVEDFFDGILSVRPDSHASYLELCILQTRAEKDERIFSSELDNIQRLLEKHMASSSGLPASCPPASAPPGTNAQDKATAARIVSGEGLNIGTSPNSVFLQGLSTDTLIAELNFRASLKANSVSPAGKLD